MGSTCLAWALEHAVTTEPNESLARAAGHSITAPNAVIRSLSRRERRYGRSSAG
jgi:hypothetical protein